MRTPFAAFTVFCAMCVSLMLSQRVHAQACQPVWQPMDDRLPISVISASAEYDPDGAGPLTPRLLLAGTNPSAGPSASVLEVDMQTQTWRVLGVAVSEVRAITVRPSGEVVVGGTFSSINGVPASFIASWNGSQWSALGPSVNFEVSALATLPSGDVIAGGNFTAAGSTTLNFIGRWDGSQWNPLGSGMSFRVSSLLVTSAGDLIAGGSFASAGGVTALRIARWNGATWSAMGTGFDGGFVNALTQLPNGDILAGGNFTSAGGVSMRRVARWNGANWEAMGAGLGPSTGNLGVLALATLPDGTPVAGGTFTTSGTGATLPQLARWNGSSWVTLSSNDPPFGNQVRVLRRLPDGTLLVGSTSLVFGPYRWDGSTWNGVLQGLNKGPGAQSPSVFIEAVAVSPAGDVFVGGDFTRYHDAPLVGIAQLDGNRWRSLGSGVNGTVRALLMLPNGDLIAGGDFTIAGGVPASRIARWDGQQWHALGEGLPNESVTHIVRADNGDIYVAGRFFRSAAPPMRSVARWDGSTWDALQGGVNGTVLDAVMSSSGEFVVVGSFSVAGNVPFVNSIARWTGASWSGVGAGFSQSAQSIERLPEGDLVASGQFSIAGDAQVQGWARWNGSVWSAFPPPPVQSAISTPSASLRVLPGWGLLASTSDGVQRWDGQAWSIVLSGFAMNDAAIRGASRLIFAGTSPGSTLPSYPYLIERAPPAGCCDSIDFNNNTVFPEDQDVIDFFSVLSGAICATCNDIDFNNNNVFPEDQDVIDFFTVLAGGTCP